MQRSNSPESFVRLSKEKNRLETLLKEKERRIEELLQERNIRETSANQKMESVESSMDEKEEEIERLHNQVKQMADTSKIERSFITEWTLANTKNQVLSDLLNKKSKRVLDLESVDQLHRMQLRNLRQEVKNMRTLFEKEQMEKTELQIQLERLNEKTQAAFKAEEISGYLTRAINGFNASINTGDPNVNYIINGMDVEMKAHVAKTEDNDMLMSAPSLAEEKEGSISSIKFSIRAVPKDMASDE